MPDSIISKVCTNCRTKKPTYEFYKRFASLDGLAPICKTCNSVKNKAWALANPDKKKASATAWNISNRSKLKAVKAAWCEENKEKIASEKAVRYTARKEKNISQARKWAIENPDRRKVATANYRAKNPEKCKSATTIWQVANPEAGRINVQNRKARKRANGGILSKDLSAKLFVLQRGKCACCKRPLGDKYHLDHIFPIALGGSNTDDNIQLLRQHCNNQKSAKHPIDFMQERGWLL